MLWNRVLVSSLATAAVLAIVLPGANASGAKDSPVSAGSFTLAQSNMPEATPGAPTPLEPKRDGGTMSTPQAAPQVPMTDTPSEEDVVGKTLFNDTGNEVATIDEIVVDPQSGKRHAVLSYGGFLGIGGRKVLMPFEQIRLVNGTAFANVSKEGLDNLPEFRPNE